MKKQSIIIYLIFIFLSCTHNPFYSGKKIKPSTLSGNIIFSDNSISENVVVWLEQLDISCKTDKDGNFELPLPPPEMQGMNLGISGTLKLYFFYSNYEMIIREIQFSQGTIAIDQDHIYNDGIFKTPITLKKLISIKTTITPNSLSVSDKKHIKVKVHITSLFDKTLRIESLRQTHSVGVKPIHCGLVFEPVEENYDSIFVYDYPRSWIYFDSLAADNGITFEYKLIPEQYIDLDSTLRSPSNIPGTYNVFPFLRIRQPGKMWNDIPISILNAIGKHHNVFGRDYHLLPMIREDALFTITE